MSIMRGVGNVAREIVKEWRGVNNVARELVKEWRGVGNVAREYFGNEMYIIKDGVAMVDYKSIPFWDYYSAAASNVLDNVTQGNGYLNVYSYGYSDMAALITKDGIDLTNYSKLNIEVDVQIYTDHAGGGYNTARLYVTSAIPSGITTGSPAASCSETLKAYTLYSDQNSPSYSTTFTSVSKSYDISSVDSIGYISVGASTWNWGNEYANVRIKNLWLS